ncbi:solute carrier family 35 member F1-like isoform X2 [Asparagus officinalis]|uniref:solute carrier family 35 member F1-like isoform X2 n=1 Tax=Asparagus officinalis TaxID=4686 RepID=UPI00098E0FAF|nr:solute carrier family 35 member F1-like isoform X2 [Asparagus officinalis]
MMINLDRFLWSKKTWAGLGLGQFVSLLITSTGFSSSELSRRGINAPTSQSFLNYLLLALFYGGFLIYRRKPLQMRWYYYLLLSVVDVEANFLVVKAYQYTSLTSVMLLDCWSIPSVIFLTWLFLKTKYRLRKFAGVAICVAGLVLVVFSDVHSNDRGGGPKPLKGDMLVIGGSMLYAISNVSEVLPFVGFALAMFLFYSTVPVILKISGSTMLNLSLLTSDMWAVLIRIFAYHEKVDWMYFIAFGAVAVGLVVYSGGDKDQGESTLHVSEISHEVEKEMDEEAAIRDPARGSSTVVENINSSTGNGKYPITVEK